MLARIVFIISFIFVTTATAGTFDYKKQDWKWESTFDSIVVVTGQKSGESMTFLGPDDSPKGPFDKDPYKDFFDERGEKPEIIVPPKSSLGTGFFINDIHIVTNYHVVKNMDTFTIYTWSFPFAVKEVVLIGYDETVDIAVLEVKEKVKHSHLDWATKNPMIGDDVYALGHGLNLIWSFTKGILSYDYRPNPLDSFVHYYQTDAVINPGNSGGVLLNEQGEVIGVNTLLISPTAYYVGYGYSIPWKLAKRVAEQIIQVGHHTKPSIGIQMGIIDDKELFVQLTGRGIEHFLEIKEVMPDSAAMRFGLMAGDIIVSMDNAPIKVVPDVIEVLWSKMPGDSVDFVVYRNYEYISLSVILGRVEVEVTEMIDVEELYDEEEELEEELEEQEEILVPQEEKTTW
jgi:S1-C subfamily serine protease